jgi:dTMP kinase
MKGKLIVIEGTDCSGKQTQTKLLLENLNKLGKKAIAFQFPRYDTPTGKIIGGPYLGKPAIGEGFFPEGAPSVPGKVASLYFLADRAYNAPQLKEYLDDGYIVILDRYVESNMAFQGGKILDKQKRYEMYDFLQKLEYDLYELPKPDIKVFLYMPYEQACILKQNREEAPDQLEKDEAILKDAESAYKEIASIYNFVTVPCVQNNQIKTTTQISKEVLSAVTERLNERQNREM